jgi:acyl transferase domain-containing protein
LRDPFGFDAAFFRMPPREARLCDPQQRLLLEVAHATFEHAGLSPTSLRGSDTGVFVGISTEDWVMQLARHLPFAEIDGSIGPGANACAAAGRLSYAFGLHGPSLAVNTACSSSLVALHLARQSLARGECELALVLGANLMLSPFTTATFHRAGMLAPDGRCKTFGAGANGYGRGEGVVGVLLAAPAAVRRLGLRRDAELLGSAVNQDGATAGLTVPSGPAQQRVLAAALRDAGVLPHEVPYVEAHGTGTLLGDPIEVQALAAVYGQGRPSERPLWLGSAKTNFGHLEAGAGLLGVLKAVLQLQHGQLAPHLHATQRNPHLPWDRLPLQVPTALQAWPAGERALAGVSSFSFTGTNAHVVLGRAAPPAAVAVAVAGPAVTLAPRPLVLPLSARTPTALRAQCLAFATHLAALPPAQLVDAVATAALGRSAHRVRLAALADQPAALRRRLLAAANGETTDGLWTGTVGTAEPPPHELGPDSTPAAIAAAFVQGAAVPWPTWLPAATNRLPLPTYAFQRRPFRAPTAAAAPSPAAAADVPVAELRRRLQAGASAERAAWLTDHVRAVAAAVLQLAVEDIASDEPLAEHGFDSMRAVELATRLERDLGIPLPFVELVDGASARDVATAIARRSDGAAATEANALLARVATMSPAEVERALREARSDG